MADRTPGAMPGYRAPDVLAAMADQIERLERRIAQLEARQGQTLPADFRFEPSPDGAAVVIRRVSTEAGEQITGPL